MKPKHSRERPSGAVSSRRPEKEGADLLGLFVAASVGARRTGESHGAHRVARCRGKKLADLFPQHVDFCLELRDANELDAQVSGQLIDTGGQILDRLGHRAWVLVGSRVEHILQRFGILGRHWQVRGII